MATCRSSRRRASHHRPQPSGRNSTLQPDDVWNWARLDAPPASRTAVSLDHVRLPVAVDPCPEAVPQRQQALVFGSQRANLQDRIGAGRDARALGVGTGVVIPTLALGAVDGRNEEPRFLLFPALFHVVSPRLRTALDCIPASSFETSPLSTRSATTILDSDSERRSGCMMAEACAVGSDPMRADGSSSGL